MIVLNLKTYLKSLEKALYFTDLTSEVVAETGVRVIICPPMVFLKDAAERFSGVFAQYVDPESPGAFTGSLSAEALKMIKVTGSLLNHSEKKLRMPEKIKAGIERLHQLGLESLVCAESPAEAKNIVTYNPTYVAIEPPELIGSGISVSTAKPEIVKDTVTEIKSINDKIPILCGAGISNAEDVKKALGLGVDGVLLASAFVNAPDPKEFLKSLAGMF